MRPAYSNHQPPDDVRARARAEALAALANHRGVIRSMTDSERRRHDEADPGPAQEIGR